MPSLTALVLLLATMLAGAQAPRQATARTGDQLLTSPVVDSFRSTRTFDTIGIPVRLRIPAANIDTPLQQLGRHADGTIAVPDNPDIAGWFAEGPRPGQQGPAVIIGHLDSTRRPAVFYGVAKLAPGAEVHVDSADGRTTSFRVTAQSRVPKDLFPTDLVYSPTLQPSLRLVTCGGAFDRAAGSYRDNVIVYAEPA